MPAMKLTPIAAMRARDVSRPRAEHLAEAEAAEAPGSAERADTGRMDTGRMDRGRAESPRARTDDGEQGGATTGGVEDDRAARPGFPRRRGTRDGGRHGRSSR